MEFSFSRAQGLEGAKAFLARALSTGKFPHALLIHGAEGMGQNPLLLDLADILLCDDAAIRPCGKCEGCLGRKRNNLDNIQYVIPLEEKSKDENRELSEEQLDELSKRIPELKSEPYTFVSSEKSNIGIANIRNLQTRIAFTGSSTLPKVIMVVKAEKMQTPAANTLLKTLEEPPANTYFLISSDDRSALLPTILSRCTQLPLFPMGPDEMRKVLAANVKAWSLEAIPERLIPFAEGSPGAVLALHRNGGEALAEEAGRFLDASLRGDWSAFSDYLDGSETFADLQSAARFLHFLLRAIRLFHRLEATEGPISSGAGAAGGTGGTRFVWTREALKRQGLDPSLAEILGPLEGAANLRPDLRSYTAWIEELLSAVQSYAKPRVAALGLYLDAASKLSRKESQAC